MNRDKRIFAYIKIFNKFLNKLITRSELIRWKLSFESMRIIFELEVDLFDGE